MADAASQAGDADSSWSPGLTSGLQGSMNVLRGALLLVPQWQCISSFVFYIVELIYPSLLIKDKCNELPAEDCHLTVFYQSIQIDKSQ